MSHQANEIKNFLLENIPVHPSDIVAVAAGRFKVGRTTVNRHLNYLIKSGKVIKTGKTKQSRYMLATALDKVFIITLDEKFDEFSLFSEFIEPTIKLCVGAEAFSILEYCATEMLNNCRDHSRGKKVTISVRVEKTEVMLEVGDDGDGLFKHINDSFHFDDIREVMLELSKGKLTTDNANHTGEGIFFSSRSCDFFSITANDYCYERDNQEGDWSFFSVNKTHGTKIRMQVKRNTKRNLTDIFLRYQDGDTLEFNKTDIIIELSKSLGERLISRSQAKRVLRRLETFQHVTLDFKGVEAIGQGFVDEVFRVYQKKNPEMTFVYINACDNVRFMIERGIPREQ